MDGVARVAPANPFLADEVIGQLSTFSISEEATPLTAGDTSGGTPTFTVSGVAGDRWAMATDQPIELETLRGTATGVIENTDFGLAADIVTLTAATLLNRLNIEVRILPFFAGNLNDGFLTLTRLAGVLDAQVEVDLEIRYTKILFPGFFGNLWEYIKQMCAAHGLQCYSTGTKIGLAKAGKVDISVSVPATAQIVVSMGDIAQKIQITNYQYVPTTQGVFFKSDQVYSLEAGETQEVSVKVEGTPGTVNNPVCVAGMDLKATAGLGQYVVTGDDGYIMAPKLWSDLGGSVTAKVSEEAADEVILTIKAPDDTTRAPYRLSEGDDRPALWITGSGLLSTPKVHEIYTGAAKAPTKMIEPIENVFIADRNMAFDAGVRVAGAYSASTVTLTMSGVPDLELSRRAFVYTVPPLNTQYAVAETELAVWLGSLAGALLRFQDAVYRVSSATVGPVGVDITATQHTTFADFDEVWAGKTFDQLDVALGTGIAFEQLNIFPLTTGV